jgi:prevent-host-death family protein
MKTVWKLQDAKNRFSQVVEQALRYGPQTITRRGKPTAILISCDAFQDLAGGDGDLVDFFGQSPLKGADIDLERKPDYGRDVEL